MRQDLSVRWLGNNRQRRSREEGGPVEPPSSLTGQPLPGFRLGLKPLHRVEAGAFRPSQAAFGGKLEMSREGSPRE